MTTCEHDTIRVIAYREADAWVAQCIEYDICAHGDDFDTAMRRLTGTVNAECRHTMEKHGKVFEGIDPAPAIYADWFDAAHQTLHTDNMELRIAA